MYCKRFSQVVKALFTLACSLFCLLQTAYPQMRQIYVDNTIQDNDIKRVSFLSPSSGYVAFAKYLGYTTDSGRTYIKKYITTGNVDFNGNSVNLTFGFAINGVHAFNKDTLLAYGNYGLVSAILYSVDGANSFKLVFHSQYGGRFTEGITDMIFPPGGTQGYAVDANRVVLTLNHGASWYDNYATNPNGTFTNLAAGTGNDFYVYGHGSTSADGMMMQYGLYAKYVTLPCCGYFLRDASFVSTNKGWISVTEGDTEGILYYTSNGGTSWRKINKPATAIATAKMRFLNDSVGYALVGLYEVYKTTDSGKIWEPVPRDNNYSYLGYSHYDLQLMGDNQLWAGGGQGFLELSTNAGGVTKPKSYFTIDTVNLGNDNTVKLNSYGKAGYQYKWFRNDTLIGTNANASYVHNIYNLLDAIKLVTIKGSVTDTLVKYQSFNRAVIVRDFTPKSAAPGKTVTIYGYQFTNTKAVSFGGVAASSFRIVNDTTITAVVGSGASGDVVVGNTLNKGSLGGFILIPPPVFSDFTPKTTTAGSVVTLRGSYLTNTLSVTFGGKPAASFTVVSDNEVSAVPGPGESGTVMITTDAGSAILTGFSLQPVINDFNPKAGTTASVITINGSGFTGATGVSVGGVATVFTVGSATKITALVGNGNSGNVVVTTPAGNYTLGVFTFYQPPVITTMIPVSGPAGTSVTITGNNFSTNPDSNFVYFGRIKAAVTAATATTLTVTAPYGTTYEPVSVTTNHLTAYTAKPFHITFENGGSIQENSFAPRATISLRNLYDVTYADQMKLGDLDGDGKLDVAVGDLRATRIFRNTTIADSITFENVPSVMSGSGSKTPNFADIDGDGKLDLGIYNSDNDKVIVYLNTSVPGTISFADSIILTAYNVIFSDIDGDGKTDLIGGGYVYRNISYPGQLAFEEPVAVPGVSGSIQSTADMDRDGKQDVLSFGTTNNIITIARNISTKGHIAFETAQPFSMNFPYSVIAADLDNDDYPDVISVDPDGFTVTIFKNTSHPGTISLAAKIDLQAGISPESPVVTDVDGDGKVDILYVNSYQDAQATVSVIKNLSTTGNLKFADRVSYQSENWQLSMDAGDLNKDGRPDMVTLAQGWGLLCIFRNTVSPSPYIYSFTPEQADNGSLITIKGLNFRNITAVSFGGVSAASFNVISDSVITATVGAGASGIVTVTNSYGTGSKKGFSFGFPPSILLVSPVSGPIGTTLTITGDHFSATAGNNIVYIGRIKATVLSASTTTLTIKVPAGTTYAPLSVTVNGLTGYSKEQFLTTFPVKNDAFTAMSFGTRIDKPGSPFGDVADLNGDGKLDLLYYGSGLNVLPNTSTVGNISFGSPLAFTVGSAANKMATGDLDGDGKLDVVVSNYGMPYVSCLRNTSAGSTITFAAWQKVAATYNISPENIIVEDLDGDGKPEIIISNYHLTFNILRNLSVPGTLAFDEILNYNLGFYAGGLTVSDYDGDGKRDLLVPSYFTNEVLFYRNISTYGSIKFDSPISIAVPGGSANLRAASGDLNGDGKPDVVTVDNDKGVVRLFINNSTPGNLNMTYTRSFATAGGPKSVSINDMDGDGKPDLVTADEGATAVSVLKNISSADSISFAGPVSYSVPNYTFGSTTGDLDGDGRPDMLVFQSGGPTSIFPNLVGNTTILNICPGTDTTLTGVAGTSYQWQVNKGSGFVNIANDTMYSGTTTAKLHISNIRNGINNYSYQCLTDNFSNGIFIIKVNTQARPEVTLRATYDSICPGIAVTFTALAINKGSQPVYTWLFNGTALSVTDTAFTSKTLQQGDKVAVIVKNAGACPLLTTDTSNVITMTVNQPVTPTSQLTAVDSIHVNESFTVSVNISGIPYGTTVTLIQGVDKQPFMAYENATYTNGTITYNVPDNFTTASKRYYIVAKNTQGSCPFYYVSDTVKVKVLSTDDGQKDTITVVLCSDADKALSTTLTGTFYQWQENRGQGFVDINDNAIYADTKTPVLTLSHVLASFNNYQYRCLVDGKSREYYNLSIVTSLVPSVQVSASADSICSGQRVVFTAVPSNGGTTPLYQWMVNSATVAATGRQFTPDGLTDGDKVQVIMTSTASCTTNSRDTSEPAGLHVFTLAPALQYTDDIFKVTNVDAGVTFNWQLNNNNSWTQVSTAGPNYAPAVQGVYRVIVSIATCSWTSPEVNTITTDTTVTPPVVDTIPDVNTAGAVVYPNPASASIVVNNLKLSDNWSTLEISSNDGSTQSTVYKVEGMTSVTVDISKLNNGYYMVVLKRKKGKPATIRFIKI